MQILDGRRDRLDDPCRIPLIVIPFTADPIEQFSTRAQIKHQVQIMSRLEMIDELTDVWMTRADFFKDGDLVADHVLPAGHQLLVDHFAGIVFASLDVDGFFDDGTTKYEKSEIK